MDKKVQFDRIKRLGVYPEITSLEGFRANVNLGRELAKVALSWSKELFPSAETVQGVHRCCYLTTYPWAGQFRDNSRGSEGHSSAPGPNENRISKSIDDLKKDLDVRNSKPLGTDEKLTLFAFQHVALDIVKPFRDGNLHVRTAITGAQVEKVFGKDMGLMVDAREYVRAIGQADIGKRVVAMRDLFQSGIGFKQEHERVRSKNVGKFVEF